MALAPPPNLVFTVTRRQPVLVVPAKSTPKDSKELSDLDDQHSFRFHVPITQFYGNNHAMAMKGSDPVQVIKEALAETLGYYYPLAGRLREGPDRKLIVDCTGEGVVFTEGFADVSLDQFGDALQSIALQIDPLEKVRFGYVADVRTKFDPPLSSGYYGNVVVYPAILTTAGELYRKPLGYALEFVGKIKIEVTQEYIKSVIDLMVLRDRRPKFTTVNSYIVSDLTRAGFNEVDFGWGKAAYGGSALGGIPEITSFYIANKKKNQEDVFLVQIFLPAAAMKRFIVELHNMLHGRAKSSL